MDTPSSASNAKAKKSKKPLIAGIVVAVVIVAGIGFWTWHNTPGFCGVCHTPMSTYVDTFEAQPGTPAVDKWGNNVSDASSMLAVTHKQAGVECLSCHVPSLGQQIGEVTETITGDYYYPLAETSITELMENSGQNSSDEAAFCLKRLSHRRRRRRHHHAQPADGRHGRPFVQPAQQPSRRCDLQRLPQVAPRIGDGVHGMPQRRRREHAARLG